MSRTQRQREQKEYVRVAALVRKVLYYYQIGQTLINDTLSLAMFHDFYRFSFVLVS